MSREAPHFTRADWIALEKEACKRKLSTFLAEAWHVIEPAQPFIPGWHTDAICDHLQAVSDGQIRRLTIEISPGASKSLTTTVFFPAWEWGPRGMPSMRHISSSHAEPLAIRDSMRCRRLITSEWYQKRWPGVTITSDQNEKRKFENTQTGFRQACAFTGLTGNRGDRLVIDDPLSVDDAKSDAERANVEDTFLEAVPTRLNSPEHSAIIVIAQRLHERDPIGLTYLKDLGYEHLMIPMRYDPKRSRVTSIGWRDPRTVEGELMCPTRWSEERVAELEKSLGAYGASGQLQQDPKPRSGGMFTREDFKFVKRWEVPAGSNDVRAWDLASTKLVGSNDPDATAGVRMREVNGIYYILDVKHAQENANEVERLLVRTAVTDGVDIAIEIPQDPASAGKAYAGTLLKLLAGFNAHAEVQSGAKETRATPFSAQVQAGNVYLVEADWNEGYLTEVCGFPVASHDDRVDASASAFNKLALTYQYNLAALMGNSNG